MDSLVKAKMVILFRLTDPQIDMWVDGRTKPVKALFVDPGVKLTLTTEMSGDTLHEMLLGTLRLTKALGSGRLKVSGSMFKALKLEDLFHTCQTQYPGIADEMLA
jgi:putative sterol carrier protein